MENCRMAARSLVTICASVQSVTLMGIWIKLWRNRNANIPEKKSTRHYIIVLIFWVTYLCIYWDLYPSFAWMKSHAQGDTQHNKIYNKCQMGVALPPKAGLWSWSQTVENREVGAGLVQSDIREIEELESVLETPTLTPSLFFYCPTPTPQHRL